MNIQISGLPDNQKIKSINFNIVFDSLDNSTICSTDLVTTIDTSQIVPKQSITESTQSAPIIQKSVIDSKDVLKPEDIDISNRIAKIDPNMLDETF